MKLLLLWTADSTIAWHRNMKAGLALVFWFYNVFLLGLGTIGEIWEIEWISDLPLFRLLGKY